MQDEIHSSTEAASSDEADACHFADVSSAFLSLRYLLDSFCCHDLCWHG